MSREMSVILMIMCYLYMYTYIEHWCIVLIKI